MSDLSKSKYTSLRLSFSTNCAARGGGAGAGAGAGVAVGAGGAGAATPVATGRFGHPASSTARASINRMTFADLAVVRTVSPPRREFVFDAPGAPGRLRHVNGTCRSGRYSTKAVRRPGA